MEGEHRLPVKPEVAVPEVIVEVIAYLLVFEVFFGRHKQFTYLHSRFFVKPEFIVRMRVFAAVDGRSAKRVVGVGFVEPVIFVENRKTRIFERRNVPEHFPHNFEVVVHLSAAAHIIAASRNRSAVARAARYIEFFEQVNMFAFHLAVPDEEERRGESRKPRADNISRFAVYAFGFNRASERFVIA